VAKKLGIDARNKDTMWRDQCIVVVTQAIMYSFKQVGREAA
jgi:nitric oxide synthase oxygenase domain/subunit